MLLNCYQERIRKRSMIYGDKEMIDNMEVLSTLDPNISHPRTGSNIKSSWKLENGTMLQKATPTYRTSVKAHPDPDHLPKSRKYLFFGKG